MTRATRLAICLLLLLTGPALPLAVRADEGMPRRPAGLAGRVNPFIGTGGHGHTYPGASAPFGGVQLSPDTRLDPGEWDGCGGYHYSDGRIQGFSHTHLSGTGCSDYCDVLLAPHCGDLRPGHNPPGKPASYGSAFEHGGEVAWPGYYAVTLKDHGVRAELTATPRVGMHRYTFPSRRPARLVIDLVHRDRVLDSFIRVVNNREVEGLRRSRSWARDQKVYFVARFSRPIIEHGLEVGTGFRQGLREARGTYVKAGLGFGSDTTPLVVKVGISAVSTEGARKNLEAETPGWDFDAVRRRTEAAWEKELSRVEVEGGTGDQQAVFYTALYHAFLCPNLYGDVDGRYRGRDGRIHRAAPDTHYTVFSLWDTFRTSHPLLALVHRQRTSAFIQTFLRQYEEGGRLPVWELAANETDCMIGYHAVPVIADAILQGIGGFDAEQAFQAMKHSGEEDRQGLLSYKSSGYVSADADSQGVSRTLEYAYDDWCIAMVAGKLGHDADEERYLVRAQAWKNLFDPSTGFIRGRADGHWWSPFDPADVNANYTEANAWQYLFFVPHDIAGLMRVSGGKAALAARLDGLFAADSRLKGHALDDISGLVGQYAHGNEPSHHTAWLYSYAGQPWKTQAMVRRLLDEMYRNAPDGLIGNEDCGQMSAWYVMSALGLYSVAPGSGAYALASPLFPRATVRLENGHSFVIEAPQASSAARYIQRARLDGKAWSQAFLPVDAVARGGRLELDLGSKPDLAWGTGSGNEPCTRVARSLIIPVPFVSQGTPAFHCSTEVALGDAEPGAEIRYTLDGSVPGPASARYEAPFRIDRSLTLRAVATKPGYVPSRTLTASFSRIPDGRTITIVRGKYNPLYAAGGNDALVDGLRGGPNPKQGRWQGYNGTDLEAVVDLGSVQTVRAIRMGFLHDLSRWILMPRSVTFHVSEDGKTFQPLGTVQSGVPERQEGIVRKDLGPSFAPCRARFVRVEVVGYGPLPAWHGGAGKPSFFFTDEIVIK